MILIDRLRHAASRINPNVPADVREESVKQNLRRTRRCAPTDISDGNWRGRGGPKLFKSLDLIYIAALLPH